MHSGYENLNNESIQIIDSQISNINNKDSIIKENESDSTEMSIIELNNPNNRGDELGSMKIEKDNFLDNNNNIEKGNQNLIEGNNRIISRRRFGKTFPFCFSKGEPMIVIGPHCIYLK